MLGEDIFGYNQQNVRMKNEEPIMVAPLASKRARYLWRLLQLSISYQKKLPWFNQFNDFKFPNTMEVYEPWHGEIQKTTASVFPKMQPPCNST